MSYLRSVLTSWFCCLCICIASKRPTIYYLDERCGNEINIAGDAIIRISSHGTSYLKDGNCSVTFVKVFSQQLVAYVLDYKMNEQYVTDPKCPFESIQLRSANGSNLLGPNGYCKPNPPTDQFFLQEQGTYLYTSFGRYNQVPVVELLVSEIDKENQHSYCPPGYLECDWKDICIPDSIRCNGYDDCGNGKDEEDCGDGTIDLGVGSIVAIVLGIILGGVIVSLVVCKLIKRRRAYQTLP